MKLANSLLSQNLTNVVTNVYWPIIENDLRYVGMSKSMTF